MHKSRYCGWTVCYETKTFQLRGGLIKTQEGKTIEFLKSGEIFYVVGNSPEAPKVNRSIQL